MDYATVWWLLAGALVALELLTGTFFLLMLALGASAAAISSHAGAGLVTQLVIAALVGLVSVAGWYRYRKGANHTKARAQRSVNLDIGELIHVDHWNVEGIAEVKYRGAVWQATSQIPQPQPGTHRVAELAGNRLVLEPVSIS